MSPEAQPIVAPSIPNSSIEISGTWPSQEAHYYVSLKNDHPWKIKPSGIAPNHSNVFVIEWLNSNIHCQCKL